MKENLDGRLIRLNAKGWVPELIAAVLDIPVRRVFIRLRSMGQPIHRIVGP